MNPQRLTIVGLLAIVVAAATVAQSLLAAPEESGSTATTAHASAGQVNLVAVASPTPGERIQRTDPTPRPTGASLPSSVATSAVVTAVISRATPPTATPAPPPPPTSTPKPAGPTRTGKTAVPAVNARYIAIVDEASGELLYNKNAHARVAPASCTKIGTAIVAIERGTPKQVVKVKFDASELIDSTLMGIRNGDEVTLEDLLYGLMLPSGNDAALAIAEHIAGSKPAFVEMMNAKVKDLGLENTQFKNPHGLDQTGHYSSAYDMIALARYGMTRQPLFVQLARARSWEVHGSRSWEVYNLNKMLAAYKGADGVKIGYTEDAGKTMVATATRNGHRVYVSVMGSTDLVADTTPLFDWVFANYTWP